MGRKQKQIQLTPEEKELFERIRKDGKLEVEVKNASLLDATWIISAGLKIVDKGYAKDSGFAYLQKGEGSIDFSFWIGFGADVLNGIGYILTVKEIAKMLIDLEKRLKNRIKKAKQKPQKRLPEQKKLTGWINKVEIE